MEYYSRCNVCRKISCYNDTNLKNNKKQQKVAALATIALVTSAIAGRRYDMYEMSKTSNRASNKIIDYSKCPECGSIDTTLVTKKFALYSNLKGHQYIVEDLKKEAYNYLEKKDFENAFCFATMILTDDENNYDAYLIKFLASYEINKIENLDTIIIDYSNNKHFIDLVNHANDEQKKNLLQQSNKNRKAKIKYDAELLLNKDNSSELVEAINKSIEDIKNNQIEEAELVKKLEQKKYSYMYEIACSYLTQGNQDSIKKAKELFIKLDKYKDSNEKVKECNKKIETLIAKKTKKKKNILKIIFIVIISIISIIYITVVYMILIFLFLLNS